MGFSYAKIKCLGIDWTDDGKYHKIYEIEEDNFNDCEKI